MEKRGITCLWQGWFPDPFPLKDLVSGAEDPVPDLYAHFVILGRGNGIIGIWISGVLPYF